MHELMCHQSQACYGQKIRYQESTGTSCMNHSEFTSHDVHKLGFSGQSEFPNQET